MKNSIIRVAVSGSFHRDIENFSRLIEMLQRVGYQVLSPISLDIMSTGEFVRMQGESTFNGSDLERWHLHAISLADVLWVHCPEGFIGVSTAFEISYAHALGKPIYSLEEPTDIVFKSIVSKQRDVFLN